MKKFILFGLALSGLLSSFGFAAEKLRYDTGKSDDCVAYVALSDDNKLEIKGHWINPADETTKVFHFRGSYAETDKGYDLFFNGVDPKKIDEIFRGSKVQKDPSSKAWQVGKKFEGVKIHNVLLAPKAPKSK